MSHRHIAEQHYREQITRKIIKRAATAAANTIEQRDSQRIDVIPIEQPANTGPISHEQKEKVASPKAAPAASSVCQYCGITTSRVKAHERQCQRSRTSSIE